MWNWWWAWFAVAVGLNLGAGVWNVLAARCHLRAAAAWRTGEPPVGAAGADEAARKEIADWLAGVYMKMRERDQAVLAELEASTEAVRKESAAAALREARLRLAAEIGPLLQAIQKKAQALQGLQSGPAGAPGLLEDVRALSEAISKTP